MNLLYPMMLSSINTSSLPKRYLLPLQQGDKIFLLIIFFLHTFFMLHMIMSFCLQRIMSLLTNLPDFNDFSINLLTLVILSSSLMHPHTPLLLHMHYDLCLIHEFSFPYYAYVSQIFSIIETKHFSQDVLL